MSNYREELVQVAAVAIAAIEDIDTGLTKGAPYVTEHVLGNVAAERDAQEKKWGQRHLAPETWLTILTEEVGEVARAILEEEVHG